MQELPCEAVPTEEAGEATHAGCRMRSTDRASSRSHLMDVGHISGTDHSVEQTAGRSWHSISVELGVAGFLDRRPWLARSTS